jgi:SAM-dependent methyltransferase
VYAGYLATLAGLTPSSHVLDVGCGAGALALALDERLGGEGRYRGFDVDRPVIAWAQRHLSGKRFEFRHHDYWNATYNPHGDRFAAWPADDGWADIVVLKSIFTHLLPEDVEFYLAETSRVLASDGTALINAFTFEDLDDAERRRFPLDGGGYRYAREGSPESAIAYRRSWLLDRFRSVGLEPTYLPGFWRPGPDRPIAFQDLVVARRPSVVA